MKTKRRRTPPELDSSILTHTEWDRLLTVREAAMILRKPVKTLSNRLDHHQLPYVVRGHRRMLAVETVLYLRTQPKNARLSRLG